MKIELRYVEGLENDEDSTFDEEEWPEISSLIAKCHATVIRTAVEDAVSGIVEAMCGPGIEAVSARSLTWRYGQLVIDVEIVNAVNEKLEQSHKDVQEIFDVILYHLTDKVEPLGPLVVKGREWFVILDPKVDHGQ